LLIRTYASELMQDAPAPTDSAIAAFYEAHKHEADFQTREAIEASHIQVESEADAAKVLRDLQRGEDWNRLVERRSQDGATKENDGRLGRIERGGGFGPLGRQTALAESAFAAPIGVPVGPVQSSVGWHVLRVDKKIPPEPVPLESVRQRIQADLSRQMGEAYYRSTLEGLKDTTDFRWNDAAVDSFLIGRRTAAELFRQAQDAPTSDERIAAYLRVVESYPKSEFAPQAQFMAGFIYSEEKKDYDSAEAAFKRLIELYPKSELAVSANWMLQNMRSEEIPAFDDERGGLVLPEDGGTSDSRP
jgi:tetratricopeptide (TPR) repeat protein